jgi:hypothetical protein
MSALPPKADIGGDGWDVRFVPKADITDDTHGKRSSRSVRRPRPLPASAKVAHPVPSEGASLGDRASQFIMSPSAKRFRTNNLRLATRVISPERSKSVILRLNVSIVRPR